MFYRSDIYYRLNIFEFYAPVILEEYENVSKGISMRTWPEAEKFTGSWQVFGLYYDGRRMDNCCKRTPWTAKLLQDIADLSKTKVVMAGFSRMAPGTDILPHVDEVTIDRRVHLGLKVPEGDCGFEVDGVQTKWEAGKAFAFDPRKKHRAWNKTSEERVVLLVDFENFS